MPAEHVHDQVSDHVRIHQVETLSDDWYVLRKTTFDYRRRDGRWQTLTRETYDRGHGAHHDGFLIEAAAGLLDHASAEQRIQAEVEEETGYRVTEVRKVFEAFMSPGSVTERLHFFVAEYDPATRLGAGGGIAEEGEDIEVLELPMEQAMAMVASGAIADGKTIMLLQYAERALFAAVPAPAAPAEAEAEAEADADADADARAEEGRSLMILIAGPYRSGTGDDPALLARNVALMESCVLPLYAAGHLPVLGEWLALPTLALAGSQRIGDVVYQDLFHAHALRLLGRCDAVLRVGGASDGADLMVARARSLGLAVFHDMAEVPPVLHGIS